MSGLAALQDAFRGALLDAELPPPAGLRARTGDLLERCFAVYRNNVVVSLVDALAERFPVVERLVGTDFFRAMAQRFVIEQPPISPLLTGYGDSFADFIAGFAPAASVPYLADIARLEAARTRAYHAADAAPLPRDAFAALAPECLLGARLALHPSVEILRSPWAVATLWRENMRPDEPDIVAVDIAEDVLIARPHADVLVHTLHAPGFAEFLIALADREPLGVAAAAAAACDGFEPARIFADLIGLEIVIAITIDSE